MRKVTKIRDNKISDAYWILSQYPEFEVVMADLESRSIYERAARKDKNGSVDPVAMAVHMGGCELVLHIKGQIEHGRMARTPT